jgi:hypothetical protein
MWKTVPATVAAIEEEPQTVDESIEEQHGGGRC